MCDPPICLDTDCGTKTNQCGETITCECQPVCAPDGSEPNDADLDADDVGTFDESQSSPANSTGERANLTLEGTASDFFRMHIDDTAAFDNPDLRLTIDGTQALHPIRVAVNWACVSGGNDVRCTNSSLSGTTCTGLVSPGTTATMEVTANCSGGSEDATATIKVTSECGGECAATCDTYGLGWLVY
jgi:hypothetical protein